VFQFLIYLPSINSNFSVFVHKGDIVSVFPDWFIFVCIDWLRLVLHVLDTIVWTAVVAVWHSGLQSLFSVIYKDSLLGNLPELGVVEK